MLGNARVEESTVATADFNGDGYKEIVVGDTQGYLYVVSHTDFGWSVVWSRQTNIDIEAVNPPTHTSDNNIRSSPVIADLDRDGYQEIVIGVGGDVHDPNFPGTRRNGGILVYRFNYAWDFSIMQLRSADGTRGWPQPCKDEVGTGPGYAYPDGFWDGIYPTPAVADLDGDGDLEIVYLGIDRYFYAWHHDGALVTGWPFRFSMDGGLSSPAVGDLDLDGLPEIVVGTMQPYTLANSWKEATVWAFKGNGTVVPGFPVRTEQIIHSSPALGDVDSDGYLEIIVGSGYGTPERQNLIYAWNHDGTPLQGWPQEAPGASVVMAPPAVGDVDGDGQLEIVVGCGNGYEPASCDKLYVWKANGSLLFSMTLPSRMTSYTAMPYSPVLADYDGDSAVEILMGRLGDWAITIVDPIQQTYDLDSHQTDGGLLASPVVDDIDNDGKLEIIIGGIDYNHGNQRGALYIWDEDGSAQSALPWPMFHHNVHRTGRYPLPPQLEVTSSIWVFHQYGSSETESAMVFVRNRGEGFFEWQAIHNIPSLQILPMAGTVVTETPIQIVITTTNFMTGSHFLGSITVTGYANGRPVAGSPAYSSIYLFVGNIHKVYLPVVMKTLR